MCPVDRPLRGELLHLPCFAFFGTWPSAILFLFLPHLSGLRCLDTPLPKSRLHSPPLAFWDLEESGPLWFPFRSSGEFPWGTRDSCNKRALVQIGGAYVGTVGTSLSTLGLELPFIEGTLSRGIKHKPLLVSPNTAPERCSSPKAVEVDALGLLAIIEDSECLFCWHQHCGIYVPPHVMWKRSLLGAPPWC